MQSLHHHRSALPALLGQQDADRLHTYALKIIEVLERHEWALHPKVGVAFGRPSIPWVGPIAPLAQSPSGSNLEQTGPTPDARQCGRSGRSANAITEETETRAGASR